jgi:hypothetical protein
MIRRAGFVSSGFMRKLRESSNRAKEWTPCPRPGNRRSRRLPLSKDAPAYDRLAVGVHLGRGGAAVILGLRASNFYSLWQESWL